MEPPVDFNIDVPHVGPVVYVHSVFITQGDQT